MVAVTGKGSITERQSAWADKTKHKITNKPSGSKAERRVIQKAVIWGHETSRNTGRSDSNNAVRQCKSLGFYILF